MAWNSRNWGKVKFKPKPYESAPSATDSAKPWNAVKTDIINDELEEKSGGNVNFETAEAKHFLKQREQNYRRNMINSKRNEPTKWENFDDDNEDRPATSNAFKQKQKQHHANKKASLQKLNHEGLRNPEEMTFEDRNLLRQKLTRVAFKAKGSSFKDAIKNMKRCGVVRKKMYNNE